MLDLIDNSEADNSGTGEADTFGTGEAKSEDNIVEADDHPIEEIESDEEEDVGEAIEKPNNQKETVAKVLAESKS